MLAARGIHVHSGENALSIERARRGKLLFRTRSSFVMLFALLFHAIV